MALRNGDEIKKGFVYVIQSLDLFKIGVVIPQNAYTENKPKMALAHRLNSYRSHNPHRVEMVVDEYVLRAGELEKALQNVFAARRVIGEWSRLTLQDLEEIKNTLRGQRAI